MRRRAFGSQHVTDHGGDDVRRRTAIASGGGLVTVVGAVLLASSSSQAEALPAAGVAIQAPAAGDPAAGAQVFAQSGCGSCHTLAAAGSTGKIGPNLDQKKPPFERVVAVVTNGGGIMPSFKGKLTDSQIADVAAFVVQATGGAQPPVTGVQPPPGAGQPPGEGQPAPGGAATSPPVGGQTSAGASAAVGPTASVVGLRLKEWKLTVRARQASAGKITFVVRNRGKERHVLLLLRTNRRPRALLKGKRVRETGRLSKIVVAPGRTRRLAVSLVAGKYVFACAIPRHYRHGMYAPLRVVAGAATGAPAAAPSPPAPSFSPPPAPPSPPIQPPTPPTPPTPPAPPPPQDGRGMFQIFCGGCHTLDAANTSGTVGPNLDDEKPDCGKVIEAVTEGKDGMPSFRNVLTRSQIQEIAAFVAQATSGSRHDEGCGQG